MIRAVLDTNVFISSIFWLGAPYRIVQKGFEGDFVIVTSPEILKEVGNTLHRKFRFPAEDTNTFLEIITLNSYLVEPQERIRAVKADPHDDKIIECALSGQAHFIVSGDHHLLDLRQYKDIKIVNPRQFLKHL